MIVNHSSVVNCGAPVRDTASNYWATFDGQPKETPHFDIYDQYMNNDHIDSELFRSQCLDEMDESERNRNNTLFEFDEIMLFKIDTDQIEACNVADEFPEIVDELLQILRDTVPGNYYGSYSAPPSAISALTQFTSWDCDTERMYLKSWDLNNNSNFNNWTYVWERAVEVRKACS